MNLGKKIVKVNKDIWCKYFSVLAYQRSVQLLYETVDILIEALTAFTVRQLQLCRKIDRQTNKFKDQAPKQHYLGRKNNLALGLLGREGLSSLRIQWWGKDLRGILWGSCNLGEYHR